MVIRILIILPLTCRTIFHDLQGGFPACACVVIVFVHMFYTVL